jgi:hypothetical protein
LRTIRIPPSRTKGNIGAFPTHQLAAWLIVKYVSATAKAAGLNRCFRLIARIYFEAIAQTPAHPRNQRSWFDCIGVMIRDRISAVIYADSALAGTPNVFEKIVFVIQQMAISKTVMKSSAYGTVLRPHVLI